MTCKNSSIKLRCSSGLKDASDIWMYFKNHEKNRTAYCRPNQHCEEFHHGWILHRETDNFDCVLEIPQCGNEDAGDYQCEFAIPNQDTWVQSETRSIAVQSIGPQHGGTRWPTEAIVAVAVLGAVLGAVVGLSVVGLGVVLKRIRTKRAAGSDHYTCALASAAVNTILKLQLKHILAPSTHKFVLKGSVRIS